MRVAPRFLTRRGRRVLAAAVAAALVPAVTAGASPSWPARVAATLAPAGLVQAGLTPASAAGVGQAAPTMLAGLHAPVAIVRTRDGIAHIYARDRHDLYFTQGWVHAQDRLFQLDYLRRVPSGTVAELLGPAALPSDVQLRTIGLRRAAQRSWAVLSPAAQQALSAYAAGVNAWIPRHPLPPEYRALNLTSVAPWTPVDTIVIDKLVAFQLSFDLDIDRTIGLQAYLAAGAAHGFNGAALFTGDLQAFAPFSKAATIPDATGRRPAEAAGPLGAAVAHAAGPPATAGAVGTATATAARSAGPGSAGGGRPAVGAGDRSLLAAAAALAARYRAQIDKVPALSAALSGDHSIGSNEWVIGGRHTVDGRPILANDPHLGLSSPSIFYPVHLVGGGLDVAGEGFAGTPGVTQGQNQWVAWGSTTNPMDVTDTYLEAVRPDPTSPSGLSTVYRGHLEHVLPVPETFRVNNVGAGKPDDLTVVTPGNGVPPATLIVPRRNNGPIVQLDTTAGTALSVQYTGFSGTRELQAILGFDDARNLSDFQRALRFFDVGSQNWSYADRRGNIAYFTSAAMPLREDLQADRVNGLPPYYIRNGQGGNEWLPVRHPQPNQAIGYEILPAAEMPHLINPSAGWFVSANNDPTGNNLGNDPLSHRRPGGGIYYLNPEYDGFRAGRITEMLRAALDDGHKLSVAGVARMQSDTVLLDAEFFAPRVVGAWRQARTSTNPALRALAADPGVAEAIGRFARWGFSTPTGIASGYDAGDRDGVHSPPSTHEMSESVAATIYAEWRSQFVRSTVDATVGRYGLPVPGDQRALAALKRVLLGGRSLSGVDLVPQPAGTGRVDAQALAMLRALRAALDRLAGPDFAAAFGGSTHQQDYRWGLLHRLVLASPLGGPFSVPPAFGQFPPPLPGLPGLPVDGGFSTVDAATHPVRADSVNGFMFDAGPARRYIGVLTEDGPVGRSALPGGTSAIPGNRHYLDLLPAYLIDERYPVRTRPVDVVEAAESLTLLLPTDQD